MTRNIFISVLIFTFTFHITPCKAQWFESFCYKNSWSPWHSWNNLLIYSYPKRSGIILKSRGGVTYFSFQITNYIPPTTQQIKEHYKKKQYFEYTGTVEYLLNEFSPTAEDIAKQSFFVQSDPRTDITPIINRRTSCIIQIAPYKKLPQLYNIWFDNIGYAIDLRNIIFSND